MTRSADVGDARLDLHWYFLAFIIWPFGTLLLACYDGRLKVCRMVIWLFTIYYGFTFVVSHDSMDANRYIERFELYSRVDYQLTDFVDSLYSPDSDLLDTFIPAVAFAAAKTFDSYRFLLAIFGLVFGYFYSRSIGFLISLTRDARGPFVILVLITFCLLFPIWRGINGARFAIAAIVFFYGAWTYFMLGKRTGWVWLFFSPLIHFACLFPLSVFLLVRAVPIPLSFAFAFFVLSVFVSEVDLDNVRRALSFLPSVFEGKIHDYTDQGYKATVEERLAGNNWYAIFYTRALAAVMFVFTLMIYVRRSLLFPMSRGAKRLLCFTILFLGAANIASLVPSGSRFQTLSFLFVAACYLLLLVRQDIVLPWQRVTHLVMLPFIGLYVLVQLRIGLDTMGVMTMFGNPIVALFSVEDIALIQLLK